MPSALPAGTVTFVFTDIEGSTRLLRSLHDDYPRMLSQHHAILDRCFALEGGVRMSEEGDGSFFVVGSAAGALRAALAAQAQLAGHEWPGAATVRVRMGMHTARAEPTAEGRYVGLAVHLAARIAALGHGGQVLVSRVTHDDVDGSLDGVGFLDLGTHRVADFPEPVEILQAYTGTPERFPPLTSAIRSELPATVGGFFGRSAEIEELRGLVSAHRLVTLLGPGGTGKTRLAVEYASAALCEGVNVSFVDLTPLSTPEFIASRVIAALGLAESPDVDPVRRIAGTLGRSSGILVLDNCEHLMPDVARLVASLLEADERVRVVATSRSSLGIPGERIFDLEPLPTRSRDGEPSPAIRLFADRAAAVSPDFALDPETLPYVVEIVDRLEGMPLALELAASVMRLLPIEDLARILADRLDVLEGGPALPGRHRSLAATVGWSVECLDERVRTAFEALGVMSGTFTVEDIAGVTGLSMVEALQVSTTLVDHSLLKPRSGPTGPMLSMLETIRWFALQALVESGREDEVRRRHLARCLRVASGAREDARERTGALAIEKLWMVRANLLDSIDYALGIGRFEAAVDLIEGLIDAWSVRAAGREAMLTLDKVLHRVTGQEPSLELRVLVARAEIRQAHGVGVSTDVEVARRIMALADEVGDHVARLRARVWLASAGATPFEDTEDALAELERIGDVRSVAFAQESVGWMYWWLDRQADAREVFGRLHRASVERRDPIGTLDGAVGLVATARTMQEVESAAILAEEASEIAARLRAGWWEAIRLQLMAGHSARLDHLEEASEWLARAHRVATESGTANQLAFVAAHEVTVAWRRGQIEVAYDKIKEFAEAHARATDMGVNPFTLEMAAAVASRWGLYEAGARLVGAAEAWRQPGGLTEEGMPLPHWDQDRHETVVEELRAGLGADLFDRLRLEGMAMDRDAASELAFTLAVSSSVTA